MDNIDDLLRVVATQISALVGVRALQHPPARRARGPLPRLRRRGAATATSTTTSADCVAGIPADGVTREPLATGRPVIVANARSDNRGWSKSTVRRWKIRSVMAVPMIFGDEIDRPDHARRRRPPARLQRGGRRGWRCAFADLAAVAVTQTQARLELQLEAGGRRAASCAALRRATAVDERLTDLVLEGRSLQRPPRDARRAARQALRDLRPEAGDRLATALPERRRRERRAAPARAASRALAGACAEALAEHDGEPRLRGRAAARRRRAAPPRRRPGRCSAKRSGAGWS